MCRPGWSHSAFRIGARAGVVVTTSWLRPRGGPGRARARASMPRSAARASAVAAALSGSRPQTRTRVNGRTRRAAAICRRAWTPVPRTPAVCDGLGGHVAGGDGAGGGGADVGQVAVVEEERLDEAGGGGEEDHQAVERGQAELGVVEEAGADLDREAGEAGEVRGLDVDLAVDCRQRHREDGGHDDAAGVERGEGALDGVDGGEVERHGATELGLGDDQDVMRHGGGLRE